MPVTKIRSAWSSGELIFYEESVGRSVTGDIFKLGTSAVMVGNTSQDIDFQFYGTGSLSAIIDCGAATFTLTGISQSTNKTMTFTGTQAIVAGTSGTPLVLTAGTPLFSIYSTNAGSSGSTNAEPLYLKSTLTGAGQVGGRAHFHTYSNVASGAWVNALKGKMEFGATGRSTGLGSAIVGELIISAGTTSGTYAAFEAEIVGDTGASCGGHTSFFYCNATGDGIAAFDTSGLFFDIGTGITAASGKFASANYQTLKCHFQDGDTTRYLVLSQAENGLALGNSTTANSYTAGTPPLSFYFTAAGSGTTNVEPLYLKSTLTGTSPVGGRAKFHTYTNVTAGGWVNGLKGMMEFGSSGKVTGLGSGVCAEIIMPGASASGTYAAIEGEVYATESWVCSGGTTSFMYLNVDGNATAITSFNTYGYLFQLGAGVVDTADGLFDVVNADDIDATAALKIKIGSTDYFIPISTTSAFNA